MDEAHKELVKRLQRIQVGMANEEEDAVLAAIAALEGLAGEVEKRQHQIDKLVTLVDLLNSDTHRAVCTTHQVQEVTAERDRLKAALSPFAAIKADDGDDFSAYDDQVVIRCEVTAGDLRKARKALGDAS